LAKKKNKHTKIIEREKEKGNNLGDSQLLSM